MSFVAFSIKSDSLGRSQILGRAVKSEHLAIGTLLSVVGVTYASMSGGSKSQASQGKQSLQQIKESVKIEASSKCVFSVLGCVQSV